MARPVSEAAAPATHAPLTPVEVTFARSGVTVAGDGRQTILELAEAHGIPMEHGCRGGGCGRCKVLCLSGDLDMACEDGLRPEEKGAGFVLSCMARPRSDATIIG